MKLNTLYFLLKRRSFVPALAELGGQTESKFF